MAVTKSDTESEPIESALNVDTNPLVADPVTGNSMDKSEEPKTLRMNQDRKMVLSTHMGPQEIH